MGAVYEVEHEQLGVRYALKAFSTENKYADVLKKKFLSRPRSMIVQELYQRLIERASRKFQFLRGIIRKKDPAAVF